MRYWISGYASIVGPLLLKLSINYAFSRRIGERTDLTVFHMCSGVDEETLLPYWGQVIFGEENSGATISIQGSNGPISKPIKAALVILDDVEPTRTARLKSSKAARLIKR